ncbi:esterase, putative [Chlorobium limicola DSM 245]|uniref:Esterase, putative n=1 Tax=Chlorobium limicola (strain DSM 245 / NBRC 103803 / 6330) TaxID=290315 RepID=B3EGN2_CHLL2|nr:PHB depolymerase family esterase [Chlorobium limicola]ACD89669.1 esterase, putative [Chlorobium limicola DSM 245]
MKIRRINALLLVAVFVSFLPFELAFGEGDLQRQTVMQGSIERTFYVHYPKNRHPAVPKALVFVLHGGGGADARTMANRTGMNEIADREDFMVIYPAGIDGQWNDGRGKSFRRTKDNTDVDDVGFISALIDLFVKKGEADSARIYVMGLSNGGMMTHRLGIELGKKLAAIAPVIANMPENISDQKVAMALPVLIMNCTDDPMMPWKGGHVRVLGKEYGTVLSTDKTVRYWVAAAQLPLKPETRYLDDVSRSDKCTVEVDRYSAAGRRTEVVLYRIRGGGHNLPGGNTPDRPRLLGPKCMDISGSEAIWSFFKKYSRAKRIASAGQ